MRSHKFWLVPGTALTLLLILVLMNISSAATSYKVLYRFKQASGDAYWPSAGVALDTSGNLYGTTASGGLYGQGTVFKLTSDSDGRWTHTVLHDFSGIDDGGNPYAGVIFDTEGNLYGTTLGGGTDGIVFKLAPLPDGTWGETVLHRLGCSPDGSAPYGGLTFDTEGSLYGTTGLGGTYGFGTVFKLKSNGDGTWSETVLHSFGNGSDGSVPYAGLIFDAAGNLYGTTLYGGTNGVGTVFRLVPSPDSTWTESVLHDFIGLQDGSSPLAGLSLDAAGNLYGTTLSGGTYGWGTVFKLTANPDRSWTNAVICSLGGTARNPFAGVIFDPAGNLYGTTQKQGGGTYGTVFRLMPGPSGGWRASLLHTFKATDGAVPFGGLARDSDGKLYGTAQDGGLGKCFWGCGVVFEIEP